MSVPDGFVSVELLQIARDTADRLREENDRLHDAKRAALKLADERAIEANGLRQALNRIRTVLLPIDDADHIETVGRAREIALSATECTKTNREWWDKECPFCGGEGHYAVSGGKLNAAFYCDSCHINKDI